MWYPTLVDSPSYQISHLEDSSPRSNLTLHKEPLLSGLGTVLFSDPQGRGGGSGWLDGTAKAEAPSQKSWQTMRMQHQKASFFLATTRAYKGKVILEDLYLRLHIKEVYCNCFTS